MVLNVSASVSIRTVVNDDDPQVYVLGEILRLDSIEDFLKADWPIICRYGNSDFLLFDSCHANAIWKVMPAYHVLRAMICLPSGVNMGNRVVSARGGPCNHTRVRWACSVGETHIYLLRSHDGKSAEVRKPRANPAGFALRCKATRNQGARLRHRWGWHDSGRPDGPNKSVNRPSVRRYTGAVVGSRPTLRRSAG